MFKKQQLNPSKSSSNCVSHVKNGPKYRHKGRLEKLFKPNITKKGHSQPFWYFVIDVRAKNCRLNKFRDVQKTAAKPNRSYYKYTFSFSTWHGSFIIYFSCQYHHWLSVGPLKMSNHLTSVQEAPLSSHNFQHNYKLLSRKKYRSLFDLSVR